MMPLAWDESLRTGDSRIDEQHQFLINLVADMSADCGETREHSHVLLRVATLASYAAIHCRDEEELMERSGYPDLETHRKEHQDLAAWLENFPGEYAAGRVGLPDVVGHMRNWVETHIRQCDALLVEHLKRR